MIPIPDCQRCKLATTRQRIVSSFGSIPADVLVLADAPNRVDEMLGRPVAGPDGKVLRDLFQEAAGIAGKKSPSVHVVSLILCRPQQGNIDRPAFKSEVLNCMENIVTIKEACSPKLTVLMGDAAKNYFFREFEDPVCIQPCWFLRKNPGFWINAVSSLAEGLRRC